MDILGLTSENVDRIDSGTGIINDNTFEIGDTLVVMASIGSVRLIEGKKEYRPIVFGIVVFIVGVAVLGLISGISLILILAGISIAIWGFIRVPDNFLAIGTSDGRCTHIVSKDRKFLLKIRDFIREKLDKKISGTATINISAGTIAGGLAFGNNSTATGAESTVSV